jgi:zinc transporter, ZIP family
VITVIGAAAEMNVLMVFAAALVTALATGLGAIPLAFARNNTRAWIVGGSAGAAVLMLLASGLLLYEGMTESLARTFAGIATGIVAIALSTRWLRSRDDWRFDALRGAQARSALIIVGVMTVHSSAEGIGVGVSFGGSKSVGLATAAAIAVHNIPEGLAISLVLVPQGVTVWRAALWSIFSSLPQPLLAVPAFLFVEAFGAALPVGLGFAGGAMVWMILTEIAPGFLHGGRDRLAFH